MKTLEIIYWLRLVMGIIAALICTGYGLAMGPEYFEEPKLDTFINALSIALVIYLISYYVVKFKFSHEVEKPQKLMTTGIGIYILSWLVFWILSFTITKIATA